MTWIIMGIVNIIIEEEFRWLDAFWLVLGFIFLLLYRNQQKDKFLIIDETQIKENWIFGKTIPRSEIKKVKIFAGEYTFESPKRKISVPISLIAEESKIPFLKEIDNIQSEIKP
ncbi:MAG: hypothetical protein AAF688_03480 [Bacteroidota bacterium]